jgi:membrane protein implicated in regulation of membrane protease activity
MVYYDRKPPPDDDGPRPGCLDALVITRMVFGMLFWPMVGIFAVLIDASVIFVLYATNPPLALIPVGVSAVAIWLFARWDQRRNRPPGL